MDQSVFLDIGSSKVVGVIATRGANDAVQIVASACTPNRGVKKGVVVDMDEAKRAIEETIRELENETGSTYRQVVVGLGGAHVEAILAKGFHPIYPRARAITRDDVLQVVTHSRRQTLPPDREEIQFVPQRFSVDGQRGVLKPLGMNGSRLEVDTLLVTAQRSAVQNIERVIESTGRRVGGIIATSVAAGLGCLSDDAIDHGAAVVDLGAGCTTVAVFSGGSVAYVGTIPVGASHITSDIMKLLKTSPEEAERLKIEQGCAVAALTPPDDSIGVMQLGQIHERPMQRRVLCEIIESRAREIATFARQQIERSGSYGLLPGGIALTGGGSGLAGICELFGDALPGHKAYVATPKLKMGSRRGVGGEWSVVAGMARYALNEDADELTIASDSRPLTDRVKTIWSMLSGKPGSL